MTTNSTPDSVSIEIEPFDLANVTRTLTAADTLVAKAETSILGLGHSLFVEGKSADELTEADCIGATLEMLKDARSLIAAISAGLRATGGVS